MKKPFGKEWFEEKVQQVEPVAITAFGIKLYSRYGKADELIQMLRFATALANEGLERTVQEVFYNSKACICSFTLQGLATAPNEIYKRHTLFLIKRIAEATIAQFELDGNVYHGGDLLTRCSLSEATGELDTGPFGN